MIDLSYLTEEEQEIIKAVLKRDNELKKKEERRIEKLQKTERDKLKLKYLTGEWFYENKSPRNRDRIHGSDIIRASMSRSKPVTILELSEICPEKPSFLNTKSRDVFIPPELSGILEEFPSHYKREDQYHLAETQQGKSSPAAQPQAKPRKNPFNIKFLSAESSRKTDGRLSEPAKVNQTPSDPHPTPATKQQQPEAGPHITPTKPCKTSAESTQTPAEDHHGDHAEHRSLQVSEPHHTPVEQGKAIHLKPEGQAHTLTEEEGNSIAKVLEWFGRVSKDSSKVKERPSSPEDAPKQIPESYNLLDTETASPTQEEIKAKPSPKPRRGLLALFSRSDAKVESPVNVATQEHVEFQSDNRVSECQLPYTHADPEDDDISDVQNSLKLNVVPEHEANPLPSKTEDGAHLENVADDLTKPKESLHQGEGSPDRLDSLKSFWERGNRGPKIISIKKSTDSNQSEMHKLSEDESKAIDHKSPGVSISPSRVKTLSEISEGLEEMSCTYEDCLEEIMRHCAYSTFIPSHEEQPSMFEADQIPQEPPMHTCQTEIKSMELQGSPVKQKDGNPPPVPSVRKIFTQQETEPATFSNLMFLWEKERSGPKIIISNPECAQGVTGVESLGNNSQSVNKPQLIVGSTSTGPVQSPEKRKSGMTILSLKEKSPRKRSPSRVQTNSPLDGMSYSSDHESSLKMLKTKKVMKLNPIPSPIRRLSSGVQDLQSADDNLIKVATQSRTPSPRNQPKVPPRDVYPVKDSRKNGSPLRAFNIDINPSEKSKVECLENKKLIREYPAGKLIADKSSPVSDQKILTERPEHHFVSMSEDMSELNPQYQLASQPSPTSVGRFQTPGRISIGNTIGGPVHSSPKSEGQTSVPLITSPKQHRKTSDQDSDGTPVMIRERKQWIDLQPSIRLARSYIPLSYQYYLGIPESTHKSACSDQPDRQEWIRVEVGECSEEVFQGRRSNESSPSRRSQPESEEITFDSSSEAWPQSRTSSVCGSVEPSPARTVLKQVNIRPISMSKSLENLATLPSREEKRTNESRSDITLSVEDVSGTLHVPSSISDPEQMKMLSVSVPAFIQQQRSGRESDCTSVNSFYSERQRKGSTNTNLSNTSDLASMSSVTGSVMSIYSTDFGNVEVKGTIQFAINYVQKLSEFHIFVVQCRDLAVAEPKRNRSDPYVKCYLLPDKEKLGKRKTSVKKKTLNPTYNEILRFKISLESLKAHILNLSVWHNDTFGRNSFLGEVDMDLSEWDFSNSHMMDFALKGRVPVQLSPKRVNHTMELSGEMRVALRFLTQTSQSKKTPYTGEVQIWVKECKNLPTRGGNIDPFVKCAMLPDVTRKGRQKSRVVKRTANPIFNHTMVYDGLRPDDLREACVELTVWDHDRLSNHFIGGLRLGFGTGKSYGSEVDWMDSGSAEAGLWKRMTESQNEWVEDVIPLRMLIMARTVYK